MWSKLKKWWIEFWVNPWVGGMVVFAFISVVSFFQINSYLADKNNLNGAWTVSGIVFGLAAAFCLYKANKTSDGKGG